jgi:hypothetical protein
MACGTKLTHGQMQNLLRGAGFPDVIVPSKSGNVPLIALMSAIGMSESSGCTDIIGTIAKGREYSVGVWQINTLVHKRFSIEQLKDPTINAGEALRIYNLQGLNAWGAYYDNRYKKYLPASSAAYTGAALPSTTGAPNEEPEENNNALIVALVIGALLLF